MNKENQWKCSKQLKKSEVFPNIFSNIWYLPFLFCFFFSNWILFVISHPS